MRSVDTRTLELGDDRRSGGAVHGTGLAAASDPRLHVYLVQFAPGSRTAWHAHAEGQLLVCTEGRGWVGTRDGDRLDLVAGTAVWTEPGEEHWHGASPTSAMTHLAVQTAEPPSDGSTWSELVDDSTYGGTPCPHS
ncbi:cupin domain-containing protein [Microlunatus flavus]|uniref:Cupin domain protein n=1 Tax=Microlunatus flavus TaxID=1036181 RepID=A0A1H9JKV9_9ACTN|nr:cupin domain-containing protein [Microlunatus flavus]SEQ87403.1 Cupin domain protein [Microlunatus flavus]